MGSQVTIEGLQFLGGGPQVLRGGSRFRWGAQVTLQMGAPDDR